MNIVEIKDKIQEEKNLTEEDWCVILAVDSFWGCSEDYMKAKLAGKLVKYVGCKAWEIAMNCVYGKHE